MQEQELFKSSTLEKFVQTKLARLIAKSVPRGKYVRLLELDEENRQYSLRVPMTRVEHNIMDLALTEDAKVLAQRIRYYKGGRYNGWTTLVFAHSGSPAHVSLSEGQPKALVEPDLDFLFGLTGVDDPTHSTDTLSVSFDPASGKIAGMWFRPSYRDYKRSSVHITFDLESGIITYSTDFDYFGTKPASNILVPQGKPFDPTDDLTVLINTSGEGCMATAASKQLGVTYTLTSKSLIPQVDQLTAAILNDGWGWRDIEANLPASGGVLPNFSSI